MSTEPYIFLVTVTGPQGETYQIHSASQQTIGNWLMEIAVTLSQRYAQSIQHGAPFDLKVSIR